MKRFLMLTAVFLALGLMAVACAPAATPTPLPTYTPYATYTPMPTATPVPTDTPTPVPTDTPTPVPLGISGELIYDGSLEGDWWIGVMDASAGEQAPPLYWEVLDGPGPFSMPYIPPGTYNLMAWLAVGRKLEPGVAPQPTDPVLLCGPITVTEGKGAVLELLLDDDTRSTRPQDCTK